MDKATLTVKETAQLIGLSEKSVRKAVRDQQLPAIRVGSRVLILRAALDLVLKQGRLPSRKGDMKEG